MKIYEIMDEENKMSVGILMYYEKEKSFIVELPEYLDEWTAPLLFSVYVRKGIFTIPKDISFLWVKERIIPSGRQNISAILKNHNMKTYDEMKFLEASEGRCCQDACYIRRIEKLPDYVLKRLKKNLIDCVLLNDKKILCIFANEIIKKVDLNKLIEIKDVDKVLKNDALYRTGKIGTGGYTITFNNSIDIPAGMLYKEGITIPLTLEDMHSFIENNIIDTARCCDILGCSRQNISYMVKHEQLKPVKENVKGNLYLKGEAIKTMW